MTREIVANVIMEYIRDKGLQIPFANDRPGGDWWLRFMRRWPKLSERKPQHSAANRAFSLTEGAVSEWFSKVSATVTNAGLCKLAPEELAKRMWNCDETAFATDTASNKILAAAQAGNTSLFSVVDQPVGSVFRPTLCTKVRTCRRLGQRVDQLGYCTPCQSRGGWSDPTSLSGSGSSSCLLCPASCRKGRSFCSWMAMPLTST